MDHDARAIRASYIEACLLTKQFKCILSCMAAKLCGGSCPAETWDCIFQDLCRVEVSVFGIPGEIDSGNPRRKCGNPRRHSGKQRNGSFGKFEVSVLEGGVLVEMAFFKPPSHNSAEDASCYPGVCLYPVLYISLCRLNLGLSGLDLGARIDRCLPRLWLLGVAPRARF